MSNTTTEVSPIRLAELKAPAGCGLCGHAFAVGDYVVLGQGAFRTRATCAWHECHHGTAKAHRYYRANLRAIVADKES